MAIPTVKVTVRTAGQNGLDIPNARITAQLTTKVVYQGYVMPKRTTAETNGTGVAVLELWPNELGTTMSQYQIKVQDITTGKTFAVYAFIPNRDCNLWEVTDFETGLVLPDGVIGVPGAAATIRLGQTGFVDDPALARIENKGNFNHAVIDIIVPKGKDGVDGKDGLNGTGTMVVGAVATLPPGAEATVQNVGTSDRAVLNFGIPRGEPGLPGTGGTGGENVVGLPAGGADGQILTKVGSSNYAAAWRNAPASSGGGTGGANPEIYISIYPWEDGGVVVPNFDPVLDATSQAEYAAAINGAINGAKRTAGANKLRDIFGSAQRLQLRRDGALLVTVDYTGTLPILNDGIQIGVSLATLTGMSSVLDGDIDSGVWTATLSGGQNYGRTATLTCGPMGSGKMVQLGTDTFPGMGIKPSFSLVVPRSLDGLS